MLLSKKIPKIWIFPLCSAEKFKFSEFFWMITTQPKPILKLFLLSADVTESFAKTHSENYVRLSKTHYFACVVIEWYRISKFGLISWGSSTDTATLLFDDTKSPKIEKTDRLFIYFLSFETQLYQKGPILVEV